MRRVAEVALLVLVGLSCGGAQDGVPLRAGLRASARPDSAGLGDPVRLTVEAVLPGGARGRVVVEGDSIGGWKVLDAGRPRLREREGLRVLRQELRVAAFRLGEAGPDSLRVLAVSAAGETLVLAGPAPRLRIGGQIAPGEPVDVSAAKEIRDVVSTGLPGWILYAVAAALVIAILVYFRGRLRRRGKEIVEVAPAGPTPEEEFEAAIARLLSERLLERGEVQAFYYGVSAAVRRYLERVHGLPLLESTSAEVLDLLGPRMGTTESREALSAWLREGDLVKYARLDRLAAEAGGYLDRSRDLIRLLAAAAGASQEIREAQG